MFVVTSFTNNGKLVTKSEGVVIVTQSEWHPT
jgi:hypothetical protein